MSLLLFLVLFPLLPALTLLFIKHEGARKLAVIVSTIMIAAASIYLLATGTQGSRFFQLLNPTIEKGMVIVEIVLALFILTLCIQHKKILSAILILLQTGVAAWFEGTYSQYIQTKNNLFFDNFSIIMALMVGIVGSLICVFALGYMKKYHENHVEVKDNRPVFFSILFLSLSSMFGIVFSNNLLWMFFFWEVTTLCSFLLIGYTKTKEAIDNAFRALTYTLIGGLAFIVGIIYLFLNTGVMELDQLLLLRNVYALLPLALLCFAGFTKAAQFPFSSWLLGAMVAPTPVSALLHSSTMVKAGVYMIIRLAPSISGTFIGFWVSMVGGITFLLSSMISVTKSDSKQVLTWSTISSLGLIIACAGIGTNEAVWAAILLIIFHALAKSLLFLGVGTVENSMGSIDIEDMDCLVMRMPKAATMMVIGIAGMLLAPFGMLISKWDSLKSFIDTNPILVMILAFGSATTLFYWTKWMGKMIGVTKPQKNIEAEVSSSQWSTLYILSALMIGVCLFFPLISSKLIQPYIFDIYGAFTGLSLSTYIIMAFMLIVVIIIPAIMLTFFKGGRDVPAYLNGTNVDGTAFRNYYLKSYFGERKLKIIGILLSDVLLVVIILQMIGVIIQ